jgi:hypothetical protein
MSARRSARARIDQPESFRDRRTATGESGKELRARKSISVSSKDKRLRTARTGVERKNSVSRRKLKPENIGTSTGRWRQASRFDVHAFRVLIGSDNERGGRRQGKGRKVESERSTGRSALCEKDVTRAAVPFARRRLALLFRGVACRRRRSGAGRSDFGSDATELAETDDGRDRRDQEREQDGGPGSPRHCARMIHDGEYPTRPWLDRSHEAPRESE